MLEAIPLELLGTAIGAAITASAIAAATAHASRRSDQDVKAQSVAVAELEAAPQAAAPRTHLLPTLFELFGTMLDRALSDIDTTEKRAIVLPATLGVVATIGLNNLAPPDSWTDPTPMLGLVATFFGAMALVTTGICLAPMRLHLGPSSARVLEAATKSQKQLHIEIVQRMVEAFERAESVRRRKGWWLLLALVWTVLGVCVIVGFALSGGIAPAP